MSTRRIRKRLEKVEDRISPPDDGTYTLEEACRAIWQEDKRKYLKMAKGSPVLRFLMPRFEREDAGRAER